MAKPIMIQGTMSNAGKSIVTAGLCRVFVQDGYKTAPFKSQNMALNSYITEDGLEIGRAQAMQAQACRIKPSVAMNPILLKPTTDMGSQVIVNGEVYQNMQARDYFKFKKQLLPEIHKAYQKLEKEYDIIVIEGAGSPAEINLKSDDIVNMGMAKLVSSPVLLVGDIDRGGVFAQLAGTLMLLEEMEKNLIKGLIINKFRGDQSLLQPGITMLESIIHKEVLGVIPYAVLDIDDEDSLTERFDTKQRVGIIDIAVIQLPRISNFTDFRPLEAVDGVSLRYITKPSKLGEPDLILIPGSKSTIADLLWMRENGLEMSIRKLADQGTVIMGICGGYQMLGQSISDPEKIEGIEKIRGMELLPVHTVFNPEKTRTRSAGRICSLPGIWQGLSGISIQGYEIHMGTTSSEDKNHSFSVIWDELGETFEDRETSAAQDILKNKEDGFCIGNILGTYLHGIFETNDFTNKLLQIVLKKKGLPESGLVSRNFEEYQQEQYDKLAEVIRKSMDMDQIYRILEEGV